MSSGPEHYTQAEYFLDVAERMPDSAQLVLAKANVHATLALAAAAALRPMPVAGDLSGPDSEAWRAAASAE